MATLWKLADDANGAILCDACDTAARDRMTADDLAHWIANRTTVLGHCEYCGAADHGRTDGWERCMTCRWDVCRDCGHWIDSHDMRTVGLECADCACGHAADPAD